MTQDNKATSYTSNPFTASAVGLGKALLVNPVSSLLIAVLPIVLVFIIGLLIGVFSAASRGNTGLSLLISIVGFAGITVILVRSFAGSMFILKASRDNEEISASDAMNKQGSRFTGRLILVHVMEIVLLLSLMVVTYLIASAAKSVGPVIALVVLLCIYWLMARLSLAHIVVVNEDVSAVQGLKRSWNITKGHVIEMIGVSVAQTFISGFGLASIVGSVAGLSTRYEQITDYKAAGQSKPAVHWLNWFVVIIIGIFMAIYALAVGSIIRQTNKQNSSSVSASRYCYYDENSNYACTTSKAECREIDSCSKIIDSTDRINELFKNYRTN